MKKTNKKTKSTPAKPVSPTQEMLADQWNDRHPAETPVVVTLNSGGTVTTRTAGEAWLEGGVAKISLYGITGPYRLDQIKARELVEQPGNQGTK